MVFGLLTELPEGGLIKCEFVVTGAGILADAESFLTLLVLELDAAGPDAPAP